MSDPTSKPPAAQRPAVVRLRLGDGRAATLSLAEASTALGVGDTSVSSWDLEGRPYALVRDGATYRRALDGRLLERRRSESAARLWRSLPAEQAAPVVEAARAEAELALAAASDAPALAHHAASARSRLEAIVGRDAAALAADASRARGVWRPIGILPPDQYLSVVLQLTEGCSWNACTFCSLYKETTFRVKTQDELATHVAAVRSYFGRGLRLRRSLFLGDANALCVAHERLLPLVEQVAACFSVAPAELEGRALRRFLREQPEAVAGLYTFVDTWTGIRKGTAEFRAYHALGLRRVYLGLETGDPELLVWLNKPGTPSEAIELVSCLHEAELAVGVIVLLGIGGERFDESHVRRTAETLTRLRLGPSDLLYFSDFVEMPGLAYTARAQEPELRPLDAAGCARQRTAILEAWRPADARRLPRVASYDIREFIY